MIGYSNAGLFIETIDLNGRGVIDVKDGDDDNEDEFDDNVISFCSS